VPLLGCFWLFCSRFDYKLGAVGGSAAVYLVERLKFEKRGVGFCYLFISTSYRSLFGVQVRIWIVGNTKKRILRINHRLKRIGLGGIVAGVFPQFLLNIVQAGLQAAGSLLLRLNFENIGEPR